MFNKIFINKSNLLHNLNYIKNFLDGRKICVMVKANAYGHGMSEIAECLKDEDVSFGVSNQEEAFSLREITDKQIIIFGAVENYKRIIDSNIDFAVFSYNQIKNILNMQKNSKPKMHLCLNTGMNRYGINDKNEFLKIIKLLKKHKIELSGIYTHFSSLTTDEKYTERQKRLFYDFCYLLPSEWKTQTHVGGGKTVFENIDAQMFRSGIEIYGYGDKNLLPVMSVTSQIVDTVKVKKDEHIGYLCGYTAQKDMTVGAIPLGYGDGLPRKLSNKLQIEFNNNILQNVGNICMDCFMVNIDKSKAKIGDNVVIMKDATQLAKLIGSTEYEVLTNFCKFRGERIIE